MGSSFGILGFFVVAIVLFILYGVRRLREGAAVGNAEQFAQQGKPAEAIRALLAAEQHWGFNVAHDEPGTRVSALNRLQALVHLGGTQVQALGHPFDMGDLAATLEHLRHLFGTKANYSWVDGSLKSEFKVHEAPLMAKLNAGRQRFRTACLQALGSTSP